MPENVIFVCAERPYPHILVIYDGVALQVGFDANGRLDARAAAKRGSRCFPMEAVIEGVRAHPQYGKTILEEGREQIAVTQAGAPGGASVTEGEGAGVPPASPLPEVPDETGPQEQAEACATGAPALPVRKRRR